ncbi:MAG TPA: TonB family protein [Flavobacteriales bacterium]|nr:TonB family protein [Flavobacteriales bacterium]HIO72582.1 TonB family protein [Flavobacteriales bacterium]
MTDKEHIDIFSSTECLSQGDLRAYAENSLTEQAQLRVEKHLVDCAFCTDAIEGYRLVNNPVEFELRTKSIDHQIDAKSSIRSIFLNRDKLTYVAAAAVVLIFCSMVFVLIDHASKKTNQLVSDEMKQDNYQRELTKSKQAQTPTPEKGKDGEKNRSQDIATSTSTSGKLEGALGENANRAATAGIRRETPGWSDGDNIETMVADAPLNAIENDQEERRDAGAKEKDKILETTAGFYSVVKEDKGKGNRLAKSESKKAADNMAKEQAEERRYEESLSQVAQSKSVQSTAEYSIVKAELSSEAASSEANEAAEDDEFLPVQAEEGPAPAPSVTAGVEERPRYEGGDQQMIQYLVDNIRYPDSAKAQQIEGTIIVQFKVEADSSVTNVRSLNDIGGGLDEEAVRVVQSMPDWIPARRRGKAVTETYNLPVQFKLKK